MTNKLKEMIIKRAVDQGKGYDIEGDEVTIFDKKCINYVKGMRSGGCFGFDKKAEDYLTRRNNICKDYTLLEYVREMDAI